MYLCVCVCVCVKGSLVHSNLLSETENLLQPAVLSHIQTQTVTQYIIQLLFTSVIVSAVGVWQ